MPRLVVKEIPVSLDTAAETEVAVWETNDGVTFAAIAPPDMVGSVSLE